MPTLQEYLEQLYKANAQNASPSQQSGQMQDAVKQAALDAAYRSNLPNGRRIAPTGTSSHVPPGGYPHPATWDSLHDAHYTNRAPIDYTDTAANQYVESLKQRHQTAVNDGSLVQAQAQIQARNTPNPLADIESRIAALAGKPDIPGHWESEFSQDYLNQLGDRLGQAGGAAQQAFASAKNDIAADYQGGIDQRNQIQGGLTAALQGNGQNIGVDYAKSQGGQQAAQDMAYLSQVAGVNQASDLATNDKLGVIANQTGSNLGMQAREGLLTPKQWIDAQSGLSGGDRLMADFLMNKYNQTLADQRSAKEAETEGGLLSNFAQTLNNTADQDTIQRYPDLVQGLAGIKDPRTMDEANRIWNIAGDPADAVKYLETQYKEENPSIFSKLTPPTWMGGSSSNPQQNNNLLRQYQTTLANYNEDSAQQSQNQAMWKYLIDFFNNYNPNRTAVNTGNKISSSSSEKYSS